MAEAEEIKKEIFELARELEEKEARIEELLKIKKAFERHDRILNTAKELLAEIKQAEARAEGAGGIAVRDDDEPVVERQPRDDENE